MADTILRAVGLEKSLGGSRVLEGIDLEVDRGEITVIIGPNGAGKTVLLCCLAGGLQPAAGTVSIDGRPLDLAGRSSLSFLPQDSITVNHLTGGENARFYTRLHPEGTGRWRDMAATLDIAGDLDSTVRTFSGGTVRKLELAIALDPDVPLYLFDEPTAGVDLTKITRFHDILLREAAADRAVVVSSHTPIDMELADTIAVMRGGRIVTRGGPGDLLASLPDILRIRGRVGRVTDEIARHVVGERLFVRGDEIRGFLDTGRDADRTVRSLTGRDGIIDVTIEAPSFVDLFNFHTDPAVAEGAGPRPGVTVE